MISPVLNEFQYSITYVCTLYSVCRNVYKHGQRDTIINYGFDT